MNEAVNHDVCSLVGSRSIVVGAYYSRIFIFPYALELLSFRAFLYKNSGEKVLEFNVVKDNTDKQIIVSLSADVTSVLPANNNYNWWLVQLDNVQRPVGLLHGSVHVVPGIAGSL